MCRLLLALLVLVAVTLAQRQDLLSHAVGPCINGRCQPGHSCYFDECIPSSLMPRSRAKRNFETPALSAGKCVNGMCPAGYVCTETNCIRA
ncbi:unnamed protein product [Cylicocyclus nassatus]|uniref:Uncharacterized protein n=1 Tax=Cylicocyclus nassatus TaxID=53992 RepID=A0AA36DJS0_CYLNA|nr:unnamed protein product [Cylicocyclus nassatus]